ncbi:hypothetical protein [Bacteroides faecis]|uniref:hypothetical protein n=1 Tax=Bacteroides faecis TaxID=674529 RepID=UPI0039C87F75
MTMIGFIKRMWFAWRYKRAVKKAVRMAGMTGMKYYVIYINKGLKVVPKKGRQRARGKASLQEGRDGGGHRKTGALRNQIKEGGGHVYH